MSAQRHTCAYLSAQELQRYRYRGPAWLVMLDDGEIAVLGEFAWAEMADGALYGAYCGRADLMPTWPGCLITMPGIALPGVHGLHVVAVAVTLQLSSWTTPINFLELQEEMLWAFKEQLGS